MNASLGELVIFMLLEANVSSAKRMRPAKRLHSTLIGLRESISDTSTRSLRP
jgi:hypothetical protein